MQDKGDGFTLMGDRVRLDTGKKLFSGRVPRKAVAAPGSLAVSKARLDRDWSSLGQCKVSLAMEEWDEL